MNPLEVIQDAFKPFLDKEKPPVNILEAGNLWSYFAGGMSTLRNEQLSYNLVEDEELKEWFKDAAENLHKPILQEIKEFFDRENIPPPKIYPNLPVGDYRSLPAGAKLSDQELANLMSFNLLLALNYGMRGLTESIRADIGFLYAKCIMREISFAVTLKDLMQKRGWLQMHPAYCPDSLLNSEAGPAP